jgi:serine/threonine-protein kinase
VSAQQFGPYLLEELVGRGGMGEVFRAYDTQRKRTIALKLLSPGLSGDPAFTRRFRREAEVAARLTEHHIIPIHDYGEIDGRFFIDMRLVDGHSLGSLLSNGPLPPTRAVDIITQVAAALAAAHRDGLVHRDVKPSNVLVSAEPGRGTDLVYLIDFGIAGGGSSTALTATGAVLGTLDYMAPEQFSGRPADHRIDIYALGCMLHECLTATKPFPYEGLPAQMRAHLDHPPPRPSQYRSDVPAELDAVVARAMAKDPDQRYQSANELADDARATLTAAGSPVASALLATPPIDQPSATVWQRDVAHSDGRDTYVAPAQSAIPPPTPARPAPTFFRRRTTLVGAAIVLVVTLAGIGMIMKASHTTRAPGVIATVTLPEQPFGVAVTPDGRHLYVSNGGALSVVDTDSNTVTTTIPVTQNLSEVTVAPDGRHAYAASSGGTVSAVDTATNAVVATVKAFKNYTNNYGVAVTPDNEHVYISNNGGGVVPVLDTASNTVTTMIEVGKNPTGVAVSPDGKRVYALDGNTDLLTIIDAVSNTVSDTVRHGGQADKIAITPDGRHSYLSDNSNNAILLLDLTNNTVIKKIPVGANPIGVVVSQDGRYVYTANNGANTVSMIDTESNTVSATLPVGQNPLGVAVSPHGDRVYATNRGAHTVSVIDTGVG